MYFKNSTPTKTQEHNEKPYHINIQSVQPKDKKHNINGQINQLNAK